MNKQPNIAALLIVNFVLHFISACMAGVWISELVSSAGAMTPLAWFETALAVVATDDARPSNDESPAWGGASWRIGPLFEGLRR